MELKKTKIVFFTVRWLKHFGFNLSSYCEHCIEHFYKNTKKKSFYSCLNPRLRYQFNLWMLSRGLRGTVVPLPFPDDNCLKHCQRIISNHQQSAVRSVPTWTWGESWLVWGAVREWDRSRGEDCPVGWRRKSSGETQRRPPRRVRRHWRGDVWVLVRWSECWVTWQDK